MSSDRQRFGVNLSLLTLCWALVSTCNLLIVSVAVLGGHAIAENKALAALPIALQWMGTAAMAGPASFFMQRLGRKAGFWVSAATVSSGAALSVWALYEAKFGLFCAGGALIGIGNGFSWYYRFAAAEMVPDDFRSRAISLLLAGGIVAALIGPSLADVSKDFLSPVSYAGTYAAIITLYVVVVTVLFFVRIPKPPAEALRGGRPLSVIARQPAFVVAVIAAVVAYSVMGLLMSVTPLAMVLHKHDFDQATLVIQWHVLGMYVPSFFTGHLVKRFGPVNIMLVGTLFMFGCLGIGLSGVTVVHFWIALAVLGLGWNFLFVGATTLLTETYTIAERAKTQAVNEVSIFTTVGVSTFFSGTLLHEFGWSAVNYLAVPALGVVLVAILLFKWRGSTRRKTVQPAAGE